MRSSDMEVDEILEFISNELNRIKSEEFGDLTKFAKRAGLTPKNMSDFSNKYRKGSNPQFRTTYKILKTLLGHQPISLSENNLDDDIKNKVLELKNHRSRLLNLFLDVILNADNFIEKELTRIEGSLETLKNMISNKNEVTDNDLT